MNREQRRARRSHPPDRVSIRETADDLVEFVFANVEAARVANPDIDYSGRLYRCRACGSFDGAVAPRDELPDDYPCGLCGAPQEAVTECLP